MTNAVKAQIIVCVNALFGILLAAGVHFRPELQGAVVAGVNAALGLWILKSYKNSPKRVPDEAP